MLKSDANRTSIKHFVAIFNTILECLDRLYFKLSRTNRKVLVRKELASVLA